jgi:hypothetical protein
MKLAKDILADTAKAYLAKFKGRAERNTIGASGENA